MCAVKVGILIVIGRDDSKELNDWSIKLDVIRRRKSRISMMVIGRQRKQEICLFHCAVYVVDDDPKPIPSGLIFGIV